MSISENKNGHVLIWPSSWTCFDPKVFLFVFVKENTKLTSAFNAQICLVENV